MSTTARKMPAEKSAETDQMAYVVIDGVPEPTDDLVARIDAHIPTLTNGEHASATLLQEARDRLA